MIGGGQPLRPRLVVAVADTGIGIAAADLPRIFERFYRAENARFQEGMGLGLAITRHIAEQHGGRLEGPASRAAAAASRSRYHYGSDRACDAAQLHRMDQGSVELCPVSTVGRVGPVLGGSQLGVWRRESATGDQLGHLGRRPTIGIASLGGAALYTDVRNHA